MIYSEIGATAYQRLTENLDMTEQDAAEALGLNLTKLKAMEVLDKHGWSTTLIHRLLGIEFIKDDDGYPGPSRRWV